MCLFLRLRPDLLDAVAGDVARSLVDVVADVVDRAGQQVDVVTIEGRDERAVEQVDDLARQPVALVLELLDLPQVRAVRREVLEQLDELPGDADRVLRGALQEPEELSSLRDQRDTCHELSFSIGGSLSGFARRWVRRVGELAKLGRQEVGGSLADVDRVVADPLESAGDDDHAQAVFAQGRIGAELEQMLDDSTVGAVDELVERRRATPPLRDSSTLKESSATRVISSHRAPISSKPSISAGRRVDRRHELRELRDRHAVVGHSFEVEVHVQDGEHQPKIGRDGRLPGKQRRNAVLDLEVEAVDVVVEGDHLVGKLLVALLERVERAA